MGEYTKDSVITREDAWRDFKENLSRLFTPDPEGKRGRVRWFGHSVKALSVDVARMIGGTHLSRDAGQYAGMVLMIALVVLAGVGLWSLP